jgi:transcription elongation factor GreB
MGRWRPPTPQSSPYITARGFSALQQELSGLWLRRRDVVAALSAAAAEGDRSENAEYIYRKKELGGIDRRIRYLQKRLPALTIVRARPDADAVFFGATVAVTGDGGDSCYRIVGPDEADATLGDISLDSPLARALLKKRVGDTVVVTTRERRRELEITAIVYPEDQ